MTFLYVPALLLLVVYVLLLAFYHKGFRRLKQYDNELLQSKTKVSVIIPARNEEENITNCLNSILQQTYPKHLIEVIVIDDFSEDNTASIVAAFAKKNPNIMLLQLQHFVSEKINSYKKKGITIAIGKASGELILCTDADCVANAKWISTIVSYYEKTGKQFIVAPVKLSTGLSNQNKRQKTFVELFQTLDFAILQGITGASVHNGVHTMCNGANVAYTKKAFTTVNGFMGIDAIASGDDMLLMYKIKKVFPKSIGYVKSAAAMVQSLTVPSWKAFFAQRIRWASKATHYEDKKMFWALVVVYFTNVASLLLLVSLLFAPQHWLWVFFFILLKSIVEFRFLLPVLRFYEQDYLAKWYWVCIPIHIVYTIIAGFLGKFGKYEWKGRQVQ